MREKYSVLSHLPGLSASCWGGSSAPQKHLVPCPPAAQHLPVPRSLLAGESRDAPSPEAEFKIRAALSLASTPTASVELSGLAWEEMA